MAQTSTAPKKTSTDDVSAQIETLKKDVATLTSLIGDLTAQKSAEARGAVYNVADRLKTTASDQAMLAGVRAAEMKDDAVAAAEKAYTDAEDAIRRQPTMAVGIAAGIGFLIGMLATRRS